MDQHINLLLQPNEEDLEMRAALACVLVLWISSELELKVVRVGKEWLASGVRPKSNCCICNELLGKLARYNHK